ncbi:MAG: Holliday junction resolvase RuvX [Candidatus Dojkabacteria bacterium]
MRILAIDYGQKNIGLAIADVPSGVATPLEVVRKTRNSQELEEISKILQKWQVSQVVIGIALNSEGEETQSSKEARRFGSDLAQIEDITIDYIDEQNSTKDSNLGLNPKRKQKMGDAYAAAAIGQRWIGLQPAYRS